MKFYSDMILAHETIHQIDTAHVRVILANYLLLQHVALLFDRIEMPSLDVHLDLLLQMVQHLHMLRPI